MQKIEVFICVANEDIAHARELRRILSDCYGFNVFLYDHTVIPAEDFYKKIIRHLKLCEIFVPLISINLKNSSFCNQEIGFVVNQQINQLAKIFPISTDQTRPYDLIDHLYSLKCDTADRYGILKAATEFFHIVMCHSNFKHLSDRATSGLAKALRVCNSTINTSGIVYMLEMTQHEISLSKQQLNDIIWAAKNNPHVYRARYFARLSLFLEEKYKISVDS